MQKFLLAFIILSFAACNTGKTSFTSNTKGVSQFAQQNEFSLAQPKFNVDHELFTESATFTFELDQEGAEIYYTIDGSEPTKKSRKYVGRVSVYETTQLKAKAVHKEFQSSDVLEQTLFKIAPEMETTKALLLTDSNEKYPGSGPNALTDQNQCTLDFASNNSWFGFQEKEVFIHVIANTKPSAKKLCVRVLENHNAWIFAPVKIELYADGTCISSETFELPSKVQKSVAKYLTVELPEEHHQLYSVKIISAEAIPDWHLGKGTSPWLFVDELFLY